jgi:hypothetical protein
MGFPLEPKVLLTVADELAVGLDGSEDREALVVLAAHATL